jgi:hypothetical protein
MFIYIFRQINYSHLWSALIYYEEEISDAPNTKSATRIAEIYVTKDARNYCFPILIIVNMLRWHQWFPLSRNESGILDHTSVYLLSSSEPFKRSPQNLTSMWHHYRQHKPRYILIPYINVAHAWTYKAQMTRDTRSWSYAWKRSLKNIQFFFQHV